MGNAYLFYNKKDFKGIRKSLRTNQTKAEKLLWSKLRRRATGYRFRRQFQILNYITDFCCVEVKIIIELDGSDHEFRYEKDEARQEELEKMGYKVLRFTNQQIYNDLIGVWYFIQNNCEKRSKIL